VEAVSFSGQRLAISVHVGSGLAGSRRGHGAPMGMADALRRFPPRDDSVPGPWYGYGGETVSLPQPCCERRHSELLVRNSDAMEINEELSRQEGWLAARDSARKTSHDWRQCARPAQLRARTFDTIPYATATVVLRQPVIRAPTGADSGRKVMSPACLRASTPTPGARSVSE
jgi:hypothetical protein